MIFLSKNLRWQRGLALVLLLLVLFSVPVMALDEVHVVQQGDTLAGLAQKFKVDVEQLATYNNIENINLIVVGQQLLLPTSETSAETPFKTHTVAFYESFAGIAATYGISIEELLVSNGLVGNVHIWVGQQLLVPTTHLVPTTQIAPSSTTQLGQQPSSHRVQLGETLSSIALDHGLSWQSLAIYNGLKDAGSIVLGQELIIPSIDTIGTLTGPLATVEPEPEVVTPSPPTPSSHTYVMRLGESLPLVAQKFGVALGDLIEVNGLELNSPVWIGQLLRLPLLPDGSEPIVPNAAPVTAVPYVAPAPVLPIPEVLAVESVIQPLALPDAFNVPSRELLSPPDSFFLHVVEPGESLAAIARTYGLVPSAIVNLNALPNITAIGIGQQLKIPVDLEHDPKFSGKRWVEINLSEQTLTAWEGQEMFMQSIISSGLATSPTPVGLFKVWHMTRSQTMSGPGYSLDDVKYNMYFHSGYAMHGAYWHNNFGNPMSHGCVNMREQDAEQLYGFTSLGMEVLVHT